MLDILSGIVVRNINKLLKRASPQGLAFFGSLSNSVDEEFEEGIKRLIVA